MYRRIGATFSLLACLATPACVQALDLDEYESAVARLCRCDLQVPQFDGQCVETLSGRLQSVTPERRAAFLAFFAEACADSCDDAEACYQHEALCSRGACGEDAECCGFAEGATCNLETQRCLPPPG